MICYTFPLPTNGALQIVFLVVLYIYVEQGNTVSYKSWIKARAFELTGPSKYFDRGYVAIAIDSHSSYNYTVESVLLIISSTV